MKNIKKLKSLLVIIIAFFSLSVTAQSFNYNGKNVFIKHAFSNKYICSGDKVNLGKYWMYAPIPKGHEPRYTFKVENAGGGKYYLKHSYSGKYLCSGEKVNGGKMLMWGPVPKGQENKYSFKFISRGGNKFFIKHTHSGRYLCSGDKKNGGIFWLWGPVPKGHESRYTFELSEASFNIAALGIKNEAVLIPGVFDKIDKVKAPKNAKIKEATYYLKHTYSGKYLGSENKANKSKFWMYGPIPKGHEDRYSFKIIAAGKEKYYLKHQYSNKYFSSGDKVNKGQFLMWSSMRPGNEDKYAFQFEIAGKGKYYLKHVHSGKYLCSSDKVNKGKFWLWGPIPKGHESRYTFELAENKSRKNTKVSSIRGQNFAKTYENQVKVNPSSLVLYPTYQYQLPTDGKNDTEEDIGTSVQGPNLLVSKDINVIFGDPSFTYFSEKLNLFRELYEDKNPKSGYFYYLPANYNLKWNKETGEFSFYIYYLSADEEGRGDVIITAELSPSISRTDIELAEMLLSKKLNKIVKLVPIPLTESPKVSFGNTLTNFDVDESTISTNVPTDFLQPIVVSWRMDEKVDDLVGAMMHNIGISGNIEFKPYSVEGGKKISVPVKLKVNDPGTYGKMEYADAPSLLNGFYNALDYPIVMNDLIILRENQTKVHFIDRVTINNYEVQPQKFSSFSQNEVAQVQSGGLIKKMWLNYSIKPCDTCNTTVQNKILGGTSSSRVNEIEIEVLTPLEDTLVNSLKLMIKSYQGDPKGKSEVLLPIVNITEDNKTYSGGELFIDEGDDPLYEYQIFLILSDGQVVSSDWIQSNTLFIIIGESLIDNLFIEDDD